MGTGNAEKMVGLEGLTGTLGRRTKRLCVNEKLRGACSGGRPGRSKGPRLARRPDAGLREVEAIVGVTLEEAGAVLGKGGRHPMALSTICSD